MVGINNFQEVSNDPKISLKNVLKVQTVHVLEKLLYMVTVIRQNLVLPPNQSLGDPAVFGSSAKSNSGTTTQRSNG